MKLFFNPNELEPEEKAFLDPDNRGIYEIPVYPEENLDKYIQFIKKLGTICEKNLVSFINTNRVKRGREGVKVRPSKISGAINSCYKQCQDLNFPDKLNLWPNTGKVQLKDLSTPEAYCFEDLEKCRSNTCSKKRPRDNISSDSDYGDYDSDE